MLVGSHGFMVFVYSRVWTWVKYKIMDWNCWILKIAIDSFSIMLMAINQDVHLYSYPLRGDAKIWGGCEVV